MPARRSTREVPAAGAWALRRQAVAPHLLGPLDRAEEAALARRWQDGDTRALARLVTGHLGTVTRIARSYRGYGIAMQDLVQEGVVGLLQALRRFNPDRDIRLATYARAWISAAMQDYVARSALLVRPGTGSRRKALFFRLRRMTADWVGEHPAEDALAGLARRFRVSLTEVRNLAARATGGDLSLDATVTGNPRDGGLRWADRLADPAPTPEDAVIARGEAQHRRSLLGAALDRLTPRERIVIERRHLAEAAATFEAIGREFGVSKDRVRQIERRALTRLREALAAGIAVPGTG